MGHRHVELAERDHDGLRANLFRHHVISSEVPRYVDRNADAACLPGLQDHWDDLDLQLSRCAGIGVRRGGCQYCAGGHSRAAKFHDRVSPTAGRFTGFRSLGSGGFHGLHGTGGHVQAGYGLTGCDVCSRGDRNGSDHRCLGRYGTGVSDPDAAASDPCGPNGGPDLRHVLLAGRFVQHSQLRRGVQRIPCQCRHHHHHWQRRQLRHHPGPACRKRVDCKR